MAPNSCVEKAADYPREPPTGQAGSARIPAPPVIHQRPPLTFPNYHPLRALPFHRSHPTTPRPTMSSVTTTVRQLTSIHGLSTSVTNFVVKTVSFPDTIRTTYSRSESRSASSARRFPFASEIRAFGIGFHLVVGSPSAPAAISRSCTASAVPEPSVAGHSSTTLSSVRSRVYLPNAVGLSATIPALKVGNARVPTGAGGRFGFVTVSDGVDGATAGAG